MNWVDLGAVSDFPQNSISRVLVSKKNLLVANNNGDISVLRDKCPHQGASLSLGSIVNMRCAKFENGRPVFRSLGAAVQCPWHGWSFQLKDGQGIAKGNLKIRCFPVRLKGERIEIDLSSKKK